MIDYREIAVTVERLSPDSKLFKLCIIQPKHILCFKSNFSQCFWRILMRRHMEVLCQKYFYCTKMKNAESQGSSLHFLIMKNTACLKPGPKPFSPNCGFCFCFCSYLRAFRAPTVHSSLPSKLHKTSWSWPSPALPLSLHLTTFPSQQTSNKCLELSVHSVWPLTSLPLLLSPLAVEFTLPGSTFMLGFFKLSLDAPLCSHCVLSPLEISSILCDFNDHLSVDDSQTYIYISVYLLGSRHMYLVLIWVSQRHFNIQTQLSSTKSIIFNPNIFFLESSWVPLMSILFNWSYKI